MVKMQPVKEKVLGDFLRKWPLSISENNELDYNFLNPLNNRTQVVINF